MQCQTNTLCHNDELTEGHDYELYNPSLPSFPPDLTYNIYKTGFNVLSI